MEPRDWTMGSAALVLCAGLACANTLTQVDLLSNRHDDKLSAINNRDLNAMDHNKMQEPVLSDIQYRGLPADGVDTLDPKLIVKRAVVKRVKKPKKKERHSVKKAKNSKKRKKLFDKRRKSIESESESKPAKALSKSEESVKSETAPDSESSKKKPESEKRKSDKSKGTMSDSMSYSDTEEEEDSDESDDDDTDNSGVLRESSDHSEDSKTKPTEEISLSSEEPSVSSIEPLHSGPDSSPPASSDSEFESSASRTRNSQDSSEISYTLSSDASVYSSSSESGSSTEESESKTEKSKKDKNKKKKSEKESEKDKSRPAPSRKGSEEKSEAVSKSGGNLKVKAEVRKKKGKKVTKIDIKLKNKKDSLKAKQKGNFKKLKKEANRVANKLSSATRHLQATTEVLQMAHVGVNALKDNVRVEPMAENKPRLEMLKVKPAADPHKKQVLENDLNADYPLNETVEIRNWEGTFAPIHGEPYVAPLDHQPDSFWDAIYRSTDTDLPIPPNAAGSMEATTLLPNMALGRRHLADALTHSLVDQVSNTIEMKGKDKGKKEKKKPKLSIKEKKKKKKEKQEGKNSGTLISPSVPNKIKAAGFHDSDSFRHMDFQHPAVAEHEQVHPLPAQAHGVLATHAQPLGVGGLPPHPPPHTVILKAAGSSDDNLKTPSEEERESGTTYKPEGAYEYPSFRHPNFNPDTAYDENGIPIHESPGWTQPPTLPGDRRFGKERARPAASAGLAAHTNVKEQVLRPQAIHAPTLSLHVQHPGELNAHLASQQHQQVAEALAGSHLHPETHQDVHSQLLIDPHPQTHDQVGGEKAGATLILPAQHRGPPIRENVINHNIHKREAAMSGESLESISSVLSTRELHRHAASYNQRQAQHNNQAYKMSEEEFKNKEDSAPLEALNPALFVYRNMMQVKRKAKKQEKPKSAEVIAVFVNSKDGKSVQVPLPGGAKLPTIDLRQLEKDLPNLLKAKQSLQTPLGLPYNPADGKKSEAHNPLFYKRRNMFTVPDITQDNMNMNQDLVRQIALAQAQMGPREGKTMLLEDYIKTGGSGHTLQGRGRENFNPLFINPKKFFQVETNKFKASSSETMHEVKREIKESDNAALYSYQNLFSAQPHQVLPFNPSGPGSVQEGVMFPSLQTTGKENHFGSGRPGMFAAQIPVIDQSDEKPLDPQVHQYIGRGKEAINPYLLNYPQMFKVDGNTHVQQQKVQKEPSYPLDPTVQQFVGREKEALNPFLVNYPSMFKATKEKSPQTQNVQDEQIYVNNAGPRTHNNVQMSNSRIPVVDQSEEKALDPKVKQYVGKGKEAMNPFLVNFPNMFTRVEPPSDHKVNLLRNLMRRRLSSNYKVSPFVRSDMRPQLFADNEATGSWQGAQPSPPEHFGPVRTLHVAGRDQDIRRKREVSDSKEDDKTKVERRKSKLSKEISHPGESVTPSPSQAKTLKRKSKVHDKDDDDSFASYFEGADPNVVEEDESTPLPEITTRRRQMVLQTNARVLHRLTRAMRPRWRKQLLAMSLDVDNTTVQFTDSMQAEIKHTVEHTLLKKPPTKDTIDEITRELYKLIEERESNNRSVGHVLMGVEPQRDPLVKGTLHVEPDKESAAYHLQYWPAEDVAEGPRELNGTINLRQAKVNLTHKYAVSKVLRSILTVRPRELNYRQADNVLSRIFSTRPTLAVQKQNVYIHSRQKIGEIPTMTRRPDPGQEMETLYDRLISNAMENVKNVKVENRDTIRMRMPDPYIVRDTLKPATEKITQSAEEGDVTLIPVAETTAASLVLTTALESPMETRDRLANEMNKLQETISKSRNISFILMKEMEASEIKKNSTISEDTGRFIGGRSATMKGGWHLQQRIRDFRPMRPYPTMAPFVRRWPTFRKQDMDVGLPVHTFATKLTMRPKYSGPRHEPFFFNDFKRIRTVYPSRITSVTPGAAEVSSNAGSQTITAPERTAPVSQSSPITTTSKARNTVTPPETSTLFRYFIDDDSLPLQDASVESTTADFVEINVGGKIISVKPPFTLPTRPPKTTFATTRPPSTTHRSHIHRIKHHVKKGFQKFFSIFGIGKSSNEEESS